MSSGYQCSHCGAWVDVHEPHTCPPDPAFQHPPEAWAVLALYVIAVALAIAAGLDLL